MAQTDTPIAVPAESDAPEADLLTAEDATLTTAGQAETVPAQGHAANSGGAQPAGLIINQQ